MFVVTGKTGRVLASVGAVAPDADVLAEMLDAHLTSGERTGSGRTAAASCGSPRFRCPSGPDPNGSAPSSSASNSTRRPQRIKTLTNSDLVIVAGGRIVASTLDSGRVAGLENVASSGGTFERRLGDEDYIGRAQPLGSASDPVARSSCAHEPSGSAFLQQLHRQIAITGVAAVLVATLLGYAIARTVTRPLRAVTATMREMAATGDLARTVPTVRPWDDEDARLLATTFRQLTTALDRFQREAAQRERLSSLGRLSTVIAHEVRNPLMIIKTALRSLRRHVSPDVVEVADSIDEEVNRINHVVTGVLDFARPIRFSLQSADLVQICRDAAQAVTTSAADIPMAFDTRGPGADRHRRRAPARRPRERADQRAARGARADADGPRPVRRFISRRSGPPATAGKSRCATAASASRRPTCRASSSRSSRRGAPAPASGWRSPATSSRAWADRLPSKAGSTPARPCASNCRKRRNNPQDPCDPWIRAARRRRGEDPPGAGGSPARRRPRGRRCTGSPREALRLLNERPFDLLVVDNLMPELSGLDLIRELVASTAEAERPQILMMTAHATVESAIEAMKLGALDYLQKPFEIDELLVVVRRAIEHERPAHAPRLPHHRARRAVRPLRHRRPQPGDSGGHPDGEAGGAVAEHGPDHGRDRAPARSSSRARSTTGARSARCRSSRSTAPRSPRR